MQQRRRTWSGWIPQAPTLSVCALAVLAACADQPTSLPPADAAPSRSAASGATDDLITSSPQEFAHAVRAVRNDNELLVVLKDPGEPRIAEQTFRDMPLSAPLVVALSDPAPGESRRTRPGFARAGDGARRGLLQALQSLGVAPQRDEGLGVMVVAPADDKLVPVLALLLHHPAVDYVEANQQRPAQLHGTPLGTNPLDAKHTFHNVHGAWDYTRGAGGKVGVLDSGYTGPGGWHPDGQLITSTRGIQKLGFVDDYPNPYACGGTGGQAAGSCAPWDDYGHGTEMAGLIGGNDNNVGYVGIMPEGLTVSMKMVMNCNIANNSCGTHQFFIEDDDFVAAVRWGARNGVRVMSMSFSGNQGSSTYNALYEAYFSYDVLLLAATGNSSTSGPEPAGYYFVMGVGGLHADGTSYGNNWNEDVSGYAGGGTTYAACSGTAFCSPGGYGAFSAPSGKTSFATAVVAGIAGLLRAHSPGLTASQTWDRLRATANPNQGYRVDAYRALLNIRWLAVQMDGPGVVDVGVTNTWTATASNGTPGYTYTWYLNGYWAGSGPSYSTSLAYDAELRVDVTDAAGTTVSTGMYITVTCVEQPGGPACPT